jgi:hypothetical protein
MPDFEPHVLDPGVRRQQVLELKALLDTSADLSEAAFHDFFEPRLHLRALIGLYNAEMLSPDRLAWQYPLVGDFRCDFAIGDWARKAYTFVKCEDAGPNSLFVREGKQATRAWSPRFEGGYGQIIDWFYKLQGMTNTPEMEARFGKRSIRSAGVLLIGRDRYLRADERHRLEWRRDHVVVNSKYIHCVTYDQLVKDLLFRLGPSTSAGDAGR